MNEKYFEMGGDNSNGYMDLTVILDDIIERELQDPDIKERFFEMFTNFVDLFINILIKKLKFNVKITI